MRIQALLLLAGSAVLGACGSEPPPPAKPPTPPVVQPVAQPTAAPPPVANDSPTQSNLAISDEIRRACGITDAEAFFAFDSSNVRAQDKIVLKKLADCFSTGPLKGRRMRLVGHADPRGDEEYNRVLGQRRADSVKGAIATAGLDSGKMENHFARRGRRQRNRRLWLGEGSPRRRAARQLSAMQPDAAAHAPQKALDPVGLMLGSSGVVLVVLMILIVAAVLVWLIWFLKFAQLSRLRGALRAFERASENVPRGADLVALAERHKASPGGRVVLALARRQETQTASSELLGAIARRAVTAEQQRAMALMPTLSSIASASPFVGLFGTVWGIMDAFLRIGVEKSASLPVVAPAIGEALIATAFGLVAAIPATIGYNYVDKRIGDLVDELSASADVWVETLAEAERATGANPYAQQQRR
ncbi:MAG: MotA/TolQ/ExbB proton channel family protein [Polyangiaceae bacterium]